MGIFPERGVQLLGELSRNNDRDWFTANKADMTRYVLKPGEEFLALILEELNKLGVGPTEGKMLRIYRDVRFSKDKTPYNAFLRFSVWKQGAGEFAPRFMASIEPDCQIVGVGICEFSKDQLASYRSRLDEVGTALAKTGGCRVTDPELVKAPKGTPAELEEHARRKSLMAWRDMPWSGGDVDVKRWAPEMRAMIPLYEWLGTI